MKIVVAGLMAIVSTLAPAQQPWQKIQMPTAAQVAQIWKAPPPEYGPEPYYGLNGPVDETVIRRDLDTMKSLGYQAVTVQAGYGMPFAYLSPDYFKFFRTFVEEAKRRNIRVWIVDDAGYPSGFAGGKFTELKPKLTDAGAGGCPEDSRDCRRASEDNGGAGYCCCDGDQCRRWRNCACYGYK